MAHRVDQLGQLLRARKDLEPEDVAYLEAVIEITVRCVKALPWDKSVFGLITPLSSPGHDDAHGERT